MPAASLQLSMAAMQDPISFPATQNNAHKTLGWGNYQQLTVSSVRSKLLKTLNSHTLKRLASAVQLRPWPPSFQRT
jgi:hypothetical protein